jgi:drug/metabolite transporter (DMT)-like permease
MTKFKERIIDNPYILMAIILILWGTFAGVSKLSLKSIDGFQLQFYLFFIAFIEMTGICIYNGKIKELKDLPKRDILRIAAFAVPSYLYYIFYLLSLMMIPAVEASMLNYLYPIMIVIFAIPINKEKLNLNKILSLMIGFAGVIIILTNGSFRNIKISNIAGDFLAIGAAISWGIFSNLGKKNSVDTVISNYIYTTVTFLLSTAALLLFSKLTLPNWKTLLGLVWLSTSNIVLSYYLWFKALKSAPSALIASISFLTPFISLFFIMILVGEKVTIMQITGLIIILSGTAIQSFDGLIKKSILQYFDIR